MTTHTHTTPNEPGPDVRPARSHRWRVVVPGDYAWDEVRQAWNLTVDQRPVAVALPESPEDVVAIVAFARANDLRVAPQGTGHGAAALDRLDDTILLKTERMRHVTIDPDTEDRARRGGHDLDRRRRGGCRARPCRARRLLPRRRRRRLHARRRPVVARPQARHRRQPGDGDRGRDRRRATSSAPTGRTSRISSGPFAAAAARSGSSPRSSSTSSRWSEVYAGILWYPVDRAAEVLKAWRAWTDDLPDEMTSVGRILQFPPIPEIPEPIRGQSFVVVQAIWSRRARRGCAPARAAARARAGHGHRRSDSRRGAEPAAHGSRRPRAGHGRRRHARRRRRPPDRPVRRARGRHADPLGRDPPPRRRGRTALAAARRSRRVRSAVHHVRGRRSRRHRRHARSSTVRSRGSAACSRPGRASTRT